MLNLNSLYDMIETVQEGGGYGSPSFWTQHWRRYYKIKMENKTAKKIEAAIKKCSTTFCAHDLDLNRVNVKKLRKELKDLK